MSRRIETIASETVSRSSGYAALGVGGLMCSLSEAPLAMVKGGGLASLLVCCGMLLAVAGTGRVDFARSEIWTRLAGFERVSPEKTQAMIARARGEALRRHAFVFAVVAAALLAMSAAGEIHYWLYPR